ncbi:unnamed protein product [Aphanomyces euteiches]
MSRKRRIPLSKPPEARLFEADYDCWVNIVRLRQWVSSVDEFQQPCHQTPTLLLVISPISIILKVEPIAHNGPVKASDFQVLRTSLPANSRVYCPLKYEALLCEGLGVAAGSLNLTIVGRPDSEIPHAFNEIAEQFANNIPTRCALCDGTQKNTPYPGQPFRPCVCAGMEAIPRMTDAAMHSFFATSSCFWQGQPWLHMRINHVLRIEVAGSPFRYVQILGGTGCCDIALMAHTNWNDVQNENWSIASMNLNDSGYYSVVKAEFQPPSQGCRSWKDLDYIDAQARLNTPLQLPDPANPDPVTQPVLPLFKRISIKRKSGASDLDMRQVLATYDEISYLQVAMWTVLTLLNDVVLEAVPQSPTGDYRRFYAFEKKLDLPNSLMLYNDLSPEHRVVSVTYPAIDDVSKLSALQFAAIERTKKPSAESTKKKKKKKKNKSKANETDDPEDIDLAALARVREIMSRKAIANGFYQKGMYVEAYAHYSLVIHDFITFRATMQDHLKKDPQMIFNGDNLYSNRAQAALRLEWFDKVIEDCNRVIPFMVTNCANVYVVRCLHARARAYTAMHHYDCAFDDWHVLAIEAQKGNTNVPPKAYLAEQGQTLQKKQTACQVDGQWRILGTSGTLLTRFFHSTVLHPDGKSLLVFGGRSTTMYGAEENDRSIHQYIFQTQSWKNIDASGQKPPCLSGHSAVVFDRSMYVFGGSPLKDDDQTQGSFYLLNIDTWVWKRIKAANEPALRIEHTACVYKDQMILCGGIPDNNTAAAEFVLDVYNFKTKKWSVLSQHAKEKAPPASLSLHLAWIHHSKLYIFGGKADTADFYEYQNKLYAFDLETQTWLGHPTVSKALPLLPFYPGPRSESQAVCTGDTMYQFGGYAEVPLGSKYYGDGYRLTHYDDGTVSWSKFNPSSIAQPWPSARAGASFTLDALRKRILLYGGYETMRNDIVHGDIWELSLDILDEQTQDEAASKGEKVAMACGTCGQEGKWKKCARCNEKPYCSQACQKKDWPMHKTNCRKA